MPFNFSPPKDTLHSTPSSPPLPRGAGMLWRCGLPPPELRRSRRTRKTEAAEDTQGSLPGRDIKSRASSRGEPAPAIKPREGAGEIKALAWRCVIDTRLISVRFLIYEMHISQLPGRCKQQTG